jgi:5-oxoprolinase (ATP-hydrolysing)
MNNLLLGDDTRTYYETICGGSGAGPHFDGTDAVHTHMTNSAMTDPEVLEHRLPVRVVSFEVRHGSGGDGRYRGGCGVVRRLQVTEPLQVSLLMQGRRRGGAGMHGGGDGAKGEQSIHRFSGHVDSLEGVDGTIAEPGDVIEIKTPGGGGWGDPSL